MASDTDKVSVAQRLRAIQDRIAAAACRVGRDPAAVRLITVSKGVPLPPMQAAVEAGARIFGESRLQEAVEKMAAIGPREGLEWHFIGQLQRRKVRSVVGAFTLIHSVDSLELAEEVDRRAAGEGLVQRVLIEINVGGETSKTGFAPDAAASALREVSRLPHLAVEGLMTIPPAVDDPEQARPYFRELARLGDSFGRSGLRRSTTVELSMGMSHDFEVAVEEGATYVRVGTAIFGARHV